MQAERDFRVDFLKGQLAKLQNKKGARAKAKREQFKREQTLIQNLTQMGASLCILENYKTTPPPLFLTWQVLSIAMMFWTPPTQKRSTSNP